jgi:NAD+ synthase (glutamine-hydrolysing)
MSKSNISFSLPIVNVATCSLNQLGMDFINNYERIKKSIIKAKELGAKLRVGPELEICGYDCFDHFLEMDTIKLCWDFLRKILDSDLTNDIICEFGMPVLFKNSRYNCRIFCLNKKILLIRPKIILAEGSNFNENRYFIGWGYENIEIMEEYKLDSTISQITGQKTVPFGVAIIQTDDLSIASEICVESLTPFKISNIYLLEDVDIITNGCGWIHRPNNLKNVIETIIGSFRMNSVVYIFSNSNGCGGGNYIYEGSSFINSCGNYLNSTKYLGFNEVEVVNARINIEDLRTRRSNFPARNIQQNEKMFNLERIEVKFKMLEDIGNQNLLLTLPIELPIYQIDVPNQNILSVARYLWDYLKRSKMNSGYLFEITEDIYSVMIAICLKTMCKELLNLIKGNPDGGEREIILKHLKRIIGDAKFESLLKDGDITSKLIYTISYGKQSEFINKIVKYLNSNHKNLNFENVTGTNNKISRLKMINNYEYAENLIPKKPLLVISKLNSDVGHFGEYVKFGELYGDITPLASHNDSTILSSIQCSLIGYEICELLKNVNEKNTYEKDLYIDLYFNKKSGLLSLYSNLKNSKFINKMYNKLVSNLNKFITLPNPFHSSYYSPRYTYRPINGLDFEETLESKYINETKII